MLTRWNEIDSPDFDPKGKIAAICIGSCEQHGLHLPLGTDSMLIEGVTEDAARLASAQIVLLPVQKFGYSPHHRAFRGWITLSQETMFRYYMEVCGCVFANGFEKLLLLNGHGGNQSCLQTVVNELGAAGNRALLVRYWDLIGDAVAALRESPAGGMGHAGEFETSLMLHYHPELVRQDRIREYAPAAGNEYHGPDLFARNTVYQYKPFEEYSKDGNVGQPHFASREKGDKIAQCAATALARLMDYYAENTF